MDKFVALVRKKPRVKHDLVHELVAEPKQRRVAIHAIADRQRNCKQSKFILAGLVTQTQNLLRVQTLLHPNAVKYEIVNQVQLSASHNVAGRALWRALTSNWMAHRSSLAQVVLEKVDKHTV
ncbi:hypothetical protein AC1031_002164 [Aphanomyces cochlioides]|nr:hypothetical protein AC1031_002164 [Aphanomyces cochlioides]